LHGERAPVWDAHARGVFLGLHSGHTQSHIMRAIIEGINYSLYQIASCVEASVGTASHIYGSGGFIHSRLWLQWMANLFGKSITVSSTADASATGAAVLGLSALGKMETEQSGHNFVRTTETFLPQQASHAHYMKAYTVYASLYNKLKIDFRQLSDLAM
jgi:Sugar (pentulose and hexulose) kinases